MAKPNYRVYEVVNFDLSEVVIGLAPDDATAESLLEAARRPTWTADHRVTWRVVHDSLPIAEAARAAVAYVGSEAMTAYTVYVGPDRDAVPS